MKDDEKLRAIFLLRGLLESRDQFLGCRFRAREWARLVFFAYYRIWADSEHSKTVATSIVCLSRPHAGLTVRQAIRLADWDGLINEVSYD